MTPLRFVALTWTLVLYTQPAHTQVIWQHAIGGAGTMAYDVIQTRDGGFAVAGSLLNDLGAYLIRCDSEGRVLWHRVIEDVDTLSPLKEAMSGRHVFEQTDGTLLLIGSLTTDPTERLMIVRFSSDGDMQGLRYARHTMKRATQLRTGEIAAVGYLGSELVFAVSDTAGRLIVQKRFTSVAGVPTRDDNSLSPIDIVELKDGSLAAVGYSEMGGGASEHFIVRFSRAGDTIATHRLQAGRYSHTTTITQNVHGDLIAAFSTARSLSEDDSGHVVRVDSALRTSVRAMVHASRPGPRPNDMASFSNGTVIVVGSTGWGNASAHGWIARIAPSLEIHNEIHLPISTLLSVQPIDDRYVVVAGRGTFGASYLAKIDLDAPTSVRSLDPIPDVMDLTTR